MRIGDMLYVVVYNQPDHEEGEVVMGDLDGPFICETREEAENMAETLAETVDCEIIECYLTDE